MRFDLFEVVDIIYHRMMLRSHKWYRNAVKEMCVNRHEAPSSFDYWRANRLYQLHVMFKHLYAGHIRKPKKGHMLFLITMDEVFSNAKILKVLFNNIRIRVAVGATTNG